MGLGCIKTPLEKSAFKDLRRRPHTPPAFDYALIAAKWLDAHDVEYAGEIVGQYVKSHPTATPISRPIVPPRCSRDRRRGAAHSGAKPVLAGGGLWAGGYARVLKRQLSLPVSTISQ